jgi:hypothetical protein
VPVRKRRSLVPVQRESVNSSRPECLPMMPPVRAPDRDQGPRSRIAKLHFLRVCCSIAASSISHYIYHLLMASTYIEVALAPANTKLLHTVDMICIDYYEACQRKYRANSWNECHSRVEVSRQQAQKKICWDFVHALLGYGWTGHKSSSGFCDLAPSILHYNWF